MSFLKLPQMIRVKQIKDELHSIHTDAEVRHPLHPSPDEEVILLLDSGEEMIAGEFKLGSRTRELMEELELIYG